MLGKQGIGQQVAPVYRHYGQQALDDQYDNQAKISQAGFKAFLEQYAAASELARLRWPCHLDVRYGPHPAQTLDIFMGRRSDGPAPVEIFFHGGYWRMLDKKDFSYVASGFVPHGYTTVVVNYGLVPTVTLDELVEQCRRAVLWVIEHIAQYSGDQSRLYLSGHSAGAHLVAMLLATDWRQYGVADFESRVRGATAISGIYDLEPIRLSYLNKVLKLSPELVLRNSPVNAVPTSRCPLLLMVGALEGDEYLRQSSTLAQAWARPDASPEFNPLADEDHFSIRGQLGLHDSALVKLMVAPRPGSGCGL